MKMIVFLLFYGEKLNSCLFLNYNLKQLKKLLEYLKYYKLLFLQTFIKIYFKLFLLIMVTIFLTSITLMYSFYWRIRYLFVFLWPTCFSQKGMLEKNHEFIRYVLPKSSSFKNIIYEFFEQ